jgi:TRAP transporter TAXI family solute receptor
MKLRVAMFSAVASGACAVALLLLAVAFGEAQTNALRQSFQIATGPTDGTYFPVGQLIAGVVSHPPGVDRCQIAYVCGPEGLIISARTSDGSVANVLAVNAGRVDSGLAQADIVDAAVKGSGPFRRTGRQTHVRVLAGLFDEDVHLVVAVHSKISKVADLRGKRVSIGGEQSGTIEMARAVLTAYGLSERAIKARHDSADMSAALLGSKVDAFFFVGGAPVPLIDDLIARRQARLVPIDGKGREKLLKAVPALSRDAIAANTYRGVPGVQTVRVRALWIVRDTTPVPLVYGIARSLFNASNRDQLDAAMPATRSIRIDDAVDVLPAPLHPGALRYYREARAIKT